MYKEILSKITSFNERLVSAKVKDSRSNLEVGNVQNVLDGDIAIFAKEYLKWRRQGIND